MSGALAKMTMKRWNILCEKANKIGAPGTMKAGAESQGLSLSSKYITTMVEPIHIGFERTPVGNLGQRFVFRRFPRAGRRDVGGSESLDVGCPPDFENPIVQLEVGLRAA